MIYEKENKLDFVIVYIYNNRKCSFFVDSRVCYLQIFTLNPL